MENYKLSNGVKLIYEYRPGKITSFCIGFNAGALEEGEEFSLGTAHVLEHMISKGTRNRTEKEINNDCDRIFGFENAMTNYPYTIYYGTSLSEDFEDAMELYSDILLNPLFPKEGFKEEMNVILEELKDWKDDLYQYCEDSLFANSFKNRRIKELIIGSEETVKDITLEEIKKFYERYYCPENCVISFCSSLSFDRVIKIIEDYFGSWEKNFSGLKNLIYEENNNGRFIERIPSINGAKIQYIFDISDLSEEEFKTLVLFNAILGEGTSSILFDEIRTKNGLAYDIGSYIKNERGIKLLSINLGTSIGNEDKAIDIINNKIEEIKNSNKYFNSEKIRDLGKSIKLKRELKLEKSIQLCKELTTYDLMYGSAEKVYKEVENLSDIHGDKLLKLINKVMNKPTIQILTK